VVASSPALDGCCTGHQKSRHSQKVLRRNLQGPA